MGKVNLCIAASLDGYIADTKGSVDFLFEKKRVEPDDDYKNFYADVECILFGSATYRQLVEEISPDKWGYEGKKCYVFSGSQTGETENVVFTGLSPKNFAETVISQTKGTTWLFGGHKLIHSFMEADLIDEYWLYFMPVILGGGVPLFEPDHVKRPLRLTMLSKADDIVKAFYEREKA